jgi:hypothetical protein
VPHMGCMEVRMLLYGSESCMGFLPEDIPGGDFREKRSWLYSADIFELKNLASTKGWQATHDQTTALVVPSGFIVVTISEASFGIRWSVSSDQQDCTRVQYMLRHVITAFKEIGSPSTGYNQFLTFLQAG